MPTVIPAPINIAPASFTELGITSVSRSSASATLTPFAGGILARIGREGLVREMGRWSRGSRAASHIGSAGFVGDAGARRSLPIRETARERRRARHPIGQAVLALSRARGGRRRLAAPAPLIRAARREKSTSLSGNFLDRI